MPSDAALPAACATRDHHDVSGFTCRSSEQTGWLRRYARQSTATGTTRVFVVTENGGSRVVAYYAWCMAQVSAASAPARLRKGAGRYPQPVALLAFCRTHRFWYLPGCGDGTLEMPARR